MARVEVLRGPQGQLYGSNSLGGAIKNIPNRAALGVLTGDIEVSGGEISGGGADWSVSGMLNAPIGGAFAARLVAYRARQGGWYDNSYAGGPRLGSLTVLPPGAPGSLLPLIIALQPAAANYAAPAPDRTRNVNTIDTTGTRLMLEWHPIDGLRAMLMAAYEKKDFGGAAFAEYPNAMTFPPFVAVAAIDWRHYEHQQGTNAGGGDQIKLANVVVDYDLGQATLTNSTSWWSRDERLDLDLSISSFPITGVPKSIPIISNRSDRPNVVTEELRIASNGKTRVDWLAGVFWQKIDQDHSILASDLSGLDLQYYWRVALANVIGFPPPSTRVSADNRGNYVDKQTAVFGQLGFDFTPQLHGALSARWFTLDQHFKQESRGFLFGLAQGIQSGKNTDNVFTPRAELSYKPVKGQHYYASVSDGFRTGIINRSPPTPICGAELSGAGYPAGLPPTKADRVRNYEVGAKLGLLDEHLRVDAALYRTNWHNMQMDVALSAFAPIPAFSQCTYDGVINAGDARTQGAEVELATALGRGVRLEVALSYIKAEFLTTIPRLNIHSGDTLPLNPKSTGFIALHADFSAASRPGYVRAEWQYVGKKEALALDFPASQYPQGVPFTIGDYSQLNLRAGYAVSSKVTLAVKVENLLNEYGITSTNSTGGFGYPFVTTIRPRTIGATLTVAF